MSSSCVVIALLIPSQPPEAEPLRPAMLDTSSRYSFWKYPYSRLGRFSTGIPSSGMTSTTESKIPAVAPADAKPDSPVKTASEIAVMIETDRLLRPMVSWPTFIVACIVCLLLGSLLRSLLSEADFVIHSPAGEAVPEGETWRELKRLLEWRIGWNRDLIIAIAHRA